MAVSDDAEGLPADLCAAGGGLRPQARVGVLRLVAELPREADDLCEDELCDGAGVRERGVEYRDGGGLCGHQVDLVRADAEAADGEKAVGSGEGARG